MTTAATAATASSFSGSTRFVRGVRDKRILDELGLSPPEDERPPPVREVVRVPVDEEGREIGIA